MPTLNVTRNYGDGEILFQADLDAFLDDLENFLNTTKIDNSNIQDGGIDGSLKLTTASVVESKLASAAVTTSKIADDAVTTAKILASNVTTAKIADSNVTTAKIADSNVTTAKIADSNVTTAKIADGAVTPAKRSALSYALSSSSGNYSTGSTSASWVDVTNLSVSLTTTGRPVFLTLIGESFTADFPSFIGTTVTGGQSVYFRVVRDGSPIMNGQWFNDSDFLPCGAFSHFEVPAAGTYTYKVQLLTNAGTTNVFNCKLLAYEL